MPISSNRRQRVIEFATPKVADLVIVERVDCSKNVSSADAADNTAYGTPHPDTTRFPDFKLALIKNSGSTSSRDNTDQGQFQDWYYVKDRDKQDEYNWEYQAAGASTPHYDTVVRTYVTPRSGGTNAFEPDDPEITSDMPITDSDPFVANDDYILFEKKQTRSGDEFLDTLYVVEQHIYVKRVPMWRVDVDSDFPEHDVLISKETLWYIGEDPQATQKFDEDNLVSQSAGETSDLFQDEDAEIDVHEDFEIGDESNQKTNFWGVDQHGILREGKQLTDNWYAIIEKQVVGGVGLLSSYETYRSFSWPAVLDGDAPISATEGSDGGSNKGGILVHSWERRKGGLDTVATPIFKHQAWSGPTRMLIERFWQKKAWGMSSGIPVDADGSGEIEDDEAAAATTGSGTELAKIKPMLPNPINFVTPIFTLKVSSCLHNTISMWATSGTDHEVYKYSGSSFTFAATNYNDWPDSHVISDTQAPFRGGYLRERTTAYSPA